MKALGKLLTVIVFLVLMSPIFVSVYYLIQIPNNTLPNNTLSLKSTIYGATIGIFYVYDIVISINVSERFYKWFKSNLK